MSVFYTYEKNLEEEKMDFLRMLYHDKRGGQMIRLRIDGKGAASQISTCDVQELAATGTDFANYYTTVNTFRGWKRTADKVFNFVSIFIDLDCHADDPAVVQEAKNRTIQLLETAYKSGILSIPTMITDTGRGFGIQYVLTRSIAKTWKTEKNQEFYRKVRKLIFEKYQQILSADPQAAQVDPAVLEDARVCRLPGTYNAKAGKMCRLISVSGKYYELSELVQGCHLWQWKSEEEFRKEKEEKEKKRKEKVASGKMVSFNDFKMPFLSARLEQMKKLQDLRGKDCDGCREQMLFIIYSTLTQIDHDTAAEYLKAFNGRFAEPLDQCELDHIVEETDQSVGYDHRGYYKLKNEYLIDSLGLSDKEIRAIGLGMGWKRTAERQAARDKKKEVREKIVELLKQVDPLTYQEIAEAVGVSRGKVCAIAKAEGLMRYAKAGNRKQEQQEEKIISIDTVREVHNQVDKSTKIADRSVCVGSCLFPVSFLSTLAERGTGGEEAPAVAWFPWLEQLSFTSAIAKELFTLYSWGTSFKTSVPGMEELFETEMPMFMQNPEQLTDMVKKASKIFLDYHGSLDCFMILSMFKVDFPTLKELYIQKGKKEEQHKHGQKKKKTPVVDLDTETPEQRKIRIDKYLKHYKDSRFDIIAGTEEYQRRLDAAVLKEFRIVCMQVQRLKRETFRIESVDVQTKDIKKCFADLTYKDIAVICERMAHQGTIQKAKKPFFYILQTVWKFAHPDAAEAQTERLHAEKNMEKSKNGFCNFEQRTYNFDFGKFMEMNAMREITGQPPLTTKEFEKMEKEGII